MQHPPLIARRVAVRVIHDLNEHEAEHVTYTAFSWACVHCRRSFKVAASPRRSSARTGQYGMGYTRVTAHKGLIRAQKFNHLRACVGVLPGAWPITSEVLK